MDHGYAKEYARNEVVVRARALLTEKELKSFDIVFAWLSARQRTVPASKLLVWVLSLSLSLAVLSMRADNSTVIFSRATWSCQVSWWSGCSRC